MLKEIGNAFSMLMMWIARICVMMYFIYVYQRFSFLITTYNFDVRMAKSAVQASQLANENILVALTYIGQLLVVVAAILVFESMYRNRRRAVLREKMNQN